jgi:lipopolysaccharide transport system permease protein
MIRTIIKNRYLLWQFTKRQIEQRHRGSALGMLWSVLQPMLMMAIYTVVFGIIFKGRYSGTQDQTALEYALGIFLSITIFQTLAEVVGNSVSSVVSQPNLVKKVVFPLEILPIAQFGAALYQFGINLILVLLGVSTIGPGLSLQSLYFPIAILPLIPFAIGLALLLSSLGVFLRDIQNAAGPITVVLMYASAVFYSKDMIPAALWAWLKFNPILHIIEQARAVLLWGKPIHWSGFAYSLTFACTIFLFGLFTFKKLRKSFADVI